MKNWNPTEWCLFILTLTIPVTLLSLQASRIITGQHTNTENLSLIEDLLKVISGGVLGIIGTLYSKDKNNKEN
jgi:hypothetical protein